MKDGYNLIGSMWKFPSS